MGNGPTDEELRAELETWFTPAEVLEVLRPLGVHAIPILLTAVGVDKVRVVSQSAVDWQMNEPRDRRLMMVPGSQLEYAVRDRSNAFWSTGIVALRAGHDGPETRYFGVLFEPKPARALLPRAPRAEVIAPQAKATDAPKKGAGGRPQYAWWDDMWAAIAVRLAEGDFRPTSLVEVEDEMNQWIVDHDHTATESTVRLKATALWRELQERRKAEN